MKQIVFEGYLHKLYPDGIRVHGDTAYECMTALQGFPGFREEDGVQHMVILPDFGSEDALRSKTSRDVIRVKPYEDLLQGGGGKGGFFQIVIGAILVVIGIYVPGAHMLVPIGASLMIGGAIMMMMPAPKTRKSEQEERSEYLPANKNTTKAGTRIPLLYGRRKVYGHYISFNVTAGNKQTPSSLGYDGPFGELIGDIITRNPDPGGWLIDSNNEYIGNVAVGDVGDSNGDGTWGGDTGGGIYTDDESDMLET